MLDASSVVGVSVSSSEHSALDIFMRSLIASASAIRLFISEVVALSRAHERE